MKAAGQSFAIDGVVSCAVERFENRTTICFGKLSKEGYLVIIGGVTFTLIATAVLVLRFNVSPWWGLIPFVGMGVGHTIQILRMRRFKHVFLEVQPGRCVLRKGDECVFDEVISGVVVHNSHWYPDAQAAPEGVSLLFLEVNKAGNTWMYPLGSGGQYGELNGLAASIGKAARVEPKILEI